MPQTRSISLSNAEILVKMIFRDRVPNGTNWKAKPTNEDKHALLKMDILLRNLGRFLVCDVAWRHYRRITYMNLTALWRSLLCLTPSVKYRLCLVGDFLSNLQGPFRKGLGARVLDQSSEIQSPDSKGNRNKHLLNEQSLIKYGQHDNIHIEISQEHIFLW